MWRVARYIACVASGLFVAGCDDALTGVDAASGSAPVAAVSLFGGDVTVAAPRGFCIDPSASKPRRGFALIAPCGALSDTARYAAVPAFVTVQAGDAGSALVSSSGPALRALLEGPEGATLLGADVSVIATTASANFVSAYLTGASLEDGGRWQPNQWRAFVDVDDRLVTVGLRGLASEPLSQRQGERLMQQFLSVLIAANNGAQASTQTR